MRRRRKNRVLYWGGTAEERFGAGMYDMYKDSACKNTRSGFFKTLKMLLPFGCEPEEIAHLFRTRVNHQVLCPFSY